MLSQRIEKYIVYAIIKIYSLTLIYSLINQLIDHLLGEYWWNITISANICCENEVNNI